MPYIYRQTDNNPPLWTVGTYDGGKWLPESDHVAEDAAAARTAMLNGGGKCDCAKRIAELEQDIAILKDELATARLLSHQ